MAIGFPGNPFGYPAPTVLLVMFLWIPFILYLFQRFPAHRAIVTGLIIGWLYLPEAAISLPGMPDYTKMSATCYGIMLATMLYAPQKLEKFRFSWVDIPMLLWCISPFLSSMSNGLGPYDGFSQTLGQIVAWGLPYFLGRIHLTDLLAFRELALGIFLGGLSYVPLCLFEVRMSPQLHAIIYGSHAFADFSQSIRYDGFRPTVFLLHGLAVGAWMMIASLVGIWIWHAKVISKVRNVDAKWLLAALLITFVLCKSTGAYGLLVIGIVIAAIAKFLKTALPIYLIIILMVVYLYVNTQTESYFSDQIIIYLKQTGLFNEERLGSLEFRFNNEELLVDHTRERVWFGWGGWGREHLYDENGKQITVTDSLWIVAFSTRGTFGLVTMMISMLLPIWNFCWSCYPARTWFRPEVAPVAALSVGLLLFMIDCIVNAMLNPIYIMIAGGLVALTEATPASRMASIKRRRSPKKVALAAKRAAVPAKQRVLAGRR